VCCQRNNGVKSSGQIPNKDLYQYGVYADFHEKNKQHAATKDSTAPHGSVPRKFVNLTSVYYKLP